MNPGPRAHRAARLAFCCVATAVAVCAAASAAAKEPTARLGGTTSLALPGTELSQLGPIVVYLERLDAPEELPEKIDPVTIRQKNARFMPSFRVVVVGQRVDMPNVDTIYHNVFSFSRPNDFDLGLYPQGESRSITFTEPGVVKAYCSIHESMNATFLVVPSMNFDVVVRGGSFAIDDIAPGRYRLHAWTERLPTTVREVTLAAGELRRVDITLAEVSP